MNPDKAGDGMGAVELDSVKLIPAPHLPDTPEYREITGRIRESELIYEGLKARGDLPLEALLTATLDSIASSSGLDGLMIASAEGFPVAYSSGFPRSEMVAAIASLFHSTVERANAEGLMPGVEEMQLRGFGGEQMVMRFVPEMDKRYFLVVCSGRQRPHRRATARALRLCGQLVARTIGPETNPRRKHPAANLSGVNPDVQSDEA